jgi:hypothetical protein
VFILNLRSILAPLALVLRVTTAMRFCIQTAGIVGLHDFLSINFPNCARCMVIRLYKYLQLRNFAAVLEFDGLI